MDELFYILKVVLKRLPHYNFMIDEADAMNLNRETLSKEVHRYISFHSDTEMNNILESLEELFEEYTEIFLVGRTIKAFLYLKQYSGLQIGCL